MDFGTLINAAQKNGEMPKKEIKYYSTKFEPPKKEERSKQLSSNIKKFLARKEAEEKQKALEAKERRENLLDLRSHDRKATRRVAVMLKRTKSANKSVIQDAIDNDNTAVTLAGPSQPDEDDYGYVSQEASAYYNKMMQKYNNMPEEDKKFTKTKKNVNTNLKEIKDRVRAAIQREQEEALLPHKRKRKPKEKSDQDEYIKEEEKPEEKPKPKPRPPPPVMNFNDLLKLAEKKQFEPIKIEPKVKSDEDERLMTKRQKREFEKEQAWRERKEKGDTSESSKELVKPSDKMGPPNKIPKLNSSSSNGKIPKLSSSDDRKSQNSLSRPIPRKGDDKFNAPRRPDDRVPKKSDDRSHIPKKSDDRSSVPKKSDDRYPLPKKSDDRYPLPKRSDDRTSMPKKSDIKSNPGVQNQSASSDRKSFPSKESKLRTELEKSRSLNKAQPKLNSNTSSSMNRPQLSQRPSSSLDKNKSVMRKESNGIKPKGSLNERPKQFASANLKPKQFPPSDLKPKQFPPSDLKPKQFPPADLRPKQFPPPDVRRRPKDVKRKPPPMGHKRRILDDDDSEYDSEMDDFIDDDEEGADYSKYISEIFGYDKSKYRHHEDEDDNMESSFSQMMREEFISSKIGLMEDLEDMKLEAEEKKRKAIMKKKMVRK